MSKPSVGVIGLAVMGSNLARNIARNGYPVAVYNRTTSVTDQFMSDFGEEADFTSAATLEEFVASLERPRQIVIMVKAGGATDAVIDGLIPLLEKDDIIIDGGNAWFEDTVRREAKCTENGLRFLGVGISGGEEGALWGPSLMPGGPKDAWQVVAPMLAKISAIVDDEPCTDYVGPGGAGHFVKMVHNGIEYGDMQILAEAYHVLQRVGGAEPPELARIFAEWNEGVLSSFLTEITAAIFLRRDDQGKGYLVDKVLDKAGQKGTGRWTAQVALELGVAIPTISAAVDARILSSQKADRIATASVMPAVEADVDSGQARAELISDVHDATYCAKILSYTQGMALLSAASKEYDWNLNMSSIAALWRGGCIIRARFLDDIRKAYAENPELPGMLHDEFLRQEVLRTEPALRRVVARAAAEGVPALAFSGSLSYLDSYRLTDLPQNLTQAQRDFFGAHTYERKDIEGVFHSEWQPK